ncbi:tetratricopeptide repeat protein [Formosa maritima]|uniref:Tetratricopeptide repeat protein n=1 Tax=Formosa maritima TaxID=2592046 RepID=A0A5D0GCH8_9FLAO|nr:tetratricopeptide repeat protein [Formosa maritima]TYA56718.1 tetratricopeptide repeat protein [Formosa maritima]
MNNKTKYQFLFCLFFLQTILLSASDIQNKQVDSILKVATQNVYENPNKAITLALSIFDNTSLSLNSRIQALIVVSSGYTSKRDYKKSLEYINIAKDLSSDIDDKKLQIKILFMTGIQYQQLKIFDKSIEYMEEIEKRSLLHPERDSVGGYLATSYLVKGFIYKDNLNCDIALEYFNKALKEYERLGINYHNRSIGYYNKGNCYILLSEYTNAKESFNKAIELAQIEKASSLISFAQKGLAEVNTLEGKYNEAILLLQSALEKSKNVGDLVLNLGIYKGLFENYLALNQLKEYQNYYELYLKTQLEVKISERNSISDSVAENSKIINEELTLIQSEFKNKFDWIGITVLTFIAIILIKETKNKKTIKALQHKINTLQDRTPLSKE